ncbi:sulfur relay protein DsrC [Blastochloris sulfoviridis]|uniref:Sulfur relay protein DsrC n=1 Tax=Blastochloris sulfoviridis TaxID=50712 RepID=A0A5M6I2I8_9HYPH|nr:sulfur relay protein DsrC [Blastochloris sulfoviridis]KAA5602426.1 sulfur relay protein DsrC [Blastochloris sulfoviridis]
MIQISDLMIAHPELVSFRQLEALVEEVATSGEIHLYFDIKPEFADTPRDWDMRLEVIFLSAQAPHDAGAAR